jgi:hypothetical protein
MELRRQNGRNALRSKGTVEEMVWGPQLAVQGAGEEAVGKTLRYFGWAKAVIMNAVFVEMRPLEHLRVNV